MSQDAAADLPSTGYAELDLRLRETRAWLAERGELLVGSGTAVSPRPYSGESGHHVPMVGVRGFSVSIHSDFGPVDQDKTTNQDYALAWCALLAKGQAATAGSVSSWLWPTG